MALKANLFLVGAMKAGTTSLVDLLSQHPAIYSSPIKEPHYFVENPPKALYSPSRFFSLEHYFEKEFPKPLHIANVKNVEQYNKLFSLATTETYRLEGSTMYLHAPGTPQKIWNYNPDAIIIVITRAPIERAFSHYTMLTGLSKELRTFEEVMATDMENYNKGNLPWYSCLGMSLYEQSICEYKNLFKQVIVVDFEELVNNTDATLEKIFNSLKLDYFEIRPSVSKNNTGRDLRLKRFFYVLNKMGVKDVLSSIFPSSFKQWIFKKMSRKKPKKIPISFQLEDRLQQLFKTQ